MPAPPGWGNHTPAHLAHREGIDTEKQRVKDGFDGPPGEMSAGALGMNVKGNGLHMGVYTNAAMPVEPLPAECYRVALSNVIGRQHNPSVFVAGNKLRAAVRVLNGNATTNYLVAFDEKFAIETVSSGLKNPWGIVGSHVQHCNGAAMQLEDLRPFVWNGRLMAIGAIHDGKATAIRQSIVEINDECVVVAHAVQESTHHEKNWMPCVDEDSLRLVYCAFPLHVLEVDYETRLVKGMKLPTGKTYVRGSTQLVPWPGGGWLAIVHQVYLAVHAGGDHNPMLGGWAPAIKTQPTYQHQFVRFDRDLTTVRLGAPWCFQGRAGIEFCAGLAWWDGRLVASFGVADNEAWLAVLDPKVVEGTFA